ncbi:MAG: hypothetical protein ACOZCL_14745 [Bacillota bacterium]
MVKKMLISVLLMIALIINCTIAYAEPTAKKGVSEPIIVEITDNIDNTKTFEKSYALCVRAEEGTVITFSQQWYKVDEEKPIVAKKKSETGAEGEWVSVNKAEEWKIGASGLYTKAITWKTGKNRIKLTAKSKDGKTQELTMTVELVDKKQLNDLINSYILNKISEDIEED